jgi:peptidyl-prolyl cis-trans isomerase SurA
MRYFCFVAVSLCLGLHARADLINGMNVVVNDSVITYDQVEMSILPMAETLASQYRNQPQVFEQKLQQLRSDRIQELVEEKLILNEFKTAGYMLPESFIEDSIKDKIRKVYYGDRVRLTKTLQEQGMTYEMFRKQERDQIIIRAMVQQFISNEKILVSPAKIEAYYNQHTNDFKVGDQVKLRMIVINQAATAEPGTAKKVAEEVLRKIEDGVPFAELASVYSAGSQRADGGNRGWVDRSYFKPELADVAFSLKPGEHSGVIELPEGCYLMLVEDVRPAHIKVLADVRSEIEQTLKSQERNRLHKKWLDRLKAKSFVRYY